MGDLVECKHLEIRFDNDIKKKDNKKSEVEIDENSEKKLDAENGKDC